MQLITLPNLALVALSCFALDVAADSGYGGSCNSISPYHSTRAPHWVIFANCRKISGIYNVDNTINMDSCFGNSGGRLVGQLNGGFSGSCKDIHMSGTTLYATCGNGRGGWNQASINTNDFIGNYNGLMKCFGQNGLY
ncbi:CVNH domain-containing protein [Penicillium ucsense]|uniref:CVNH domain-containing protein n=1 Tax=Penicillium ucsense TaxID=2839758 RepID=A0A8J8VYF0_9EURO|nr:CVNH domain-containing protein [Penicillium ucsense]KAF7733721.1 CVNH domain-containing protein [Penicillium ucsense]